MFRKILIVVLLLFIVLQFFRPARNNTADAAKNIATLYNVPPNVGTILRTSCMDCHSNKTHYPWYAEVQPVGWWLNNHITNGKRHLNFDDFAGMRVAMQNKRMQDCLEQLKNDEMPLGSYTLIHRNAILNDSDKDVLSAWCQGVMDQIRAKYPPDSLVLPKRERK